MDKKTSLILLSLVILSVVLASCSQSSPIIRVEQGHQQCEVDADCMNIYTDHSACNCESINKAFQAGYEEKLASLKDSGVRCDWDCKYELPYCDRGSCKLKLPEQTPANLTATTSAKAPMTFFITSVGPGKGGDLGGLAGADVHCQKLAESVGAGNMTWRAYLSTTGENSVNARDRIGNGPWHNAEGELVAEDVVELHDNASRLVKLTQLNEKAEVVNGRGDSPNRHDILTGSQSDGTVFSSFNDSTCSNWRSSANGTGSARVGHHDRIGGGQEPTSWNSAHDSRGCSQENLRSTGGDGLFYCFATDGPLTQSTVHTVEITEEGYKPTNLSIRQGDTVTWINKGARDSWLASAMHPTHKLYPGSDIGKCGTAEEKNIFDACDGIAQGDSYSFTFNQVGTWPYHDHLNVKAPFFGRIVVE